MTAHRIRILPGVTGVILALVLLLVLSFTARPQPILAEGARISGVVVDLQGEPMAGVEVGAQAHSPLYPAGEIVRTTTDGAGAYRLHGLAAGAYVVRAAMPHSRMIARGSPPVELALEASQRVEDLQLVMPFGPLIISGRVLNIHGEALAEASVACFDISEEEPRRLVTVWTDEQGAFVLPGLSPGTYGVSATAFRDIHMGMLEVEAGTTGLDLVLEEYGAIEGIVLGADGMPLELFSVRYLRPEPPRKRGDPIMFCGGSSQENLATRLGSGRFKMDRVHPGDATLQVQSEGYPAQQHVVADVPSGRTRTGVILRMDPGASIEGVVLDAAGAPVAGAAIRTGRNPSSFRGTGTSTDAEGKFRIDAVPVEEKALLAAHPERGHATQLLELASAGVTQVELRLQAPGRIAGAVTLDGVRAPWVRMTLTAHDSITTTTGVDGGYVFEHAPQGEVLVALEQRRSPGTLGRHSSRRAQVAGGETVQVDFVLDSGTAVIEGYVTEHGAAPERRGSISAYAGGDLLSTSFKTDGYFIFDKLPAGDYSLQVLSHFPEEHRRILLRVDDGEHLQRDIELYPGPSVSGTVSGLRDDEGVSLWLYRGSLELPVGFPRSPEPLDREVIAITFARPDGHYDFPPLEPGRYTLVALLRHPAALGSDPKPERSLAAVRQIHVAGEEDLHVDLTLSRPMAR